MQNDVKFKSLRRRLEPIKPRFILLSMIPTEDIMFKQSQIVPIPIQHFYVFSCTLGVCFCAFMFLLLLFFETHRKIISVQQCKKKIRKKLYKTLKKCRKSIVLRDHYVWTLDATARRERSLFYLTHIL